MFPLKMHLITYKQTNKQIKGSIGTWAHLTA